MADNKAYIMTSDDKGSINISEDVVAVIAAVAAAEVEGVYGPFLSHNKDIPNVMGRKGLAKGVKLQIDGDDVSIDINIVAEVGYSVSEIGTKVQKAIMAAVQDAAGAKVSSVNVNICGIALKKK